jgi:hypothetical protein
MFKSVTMLAGGAAGVYLAVAMGAPAPNALLSHVAPASALVAQVTPSAACPGGWGTGPKSSSRAQGPSTARATGVRAGQHPCFDRLVIDLGPGSKPGYRVQYVRAFHAQGTGRVIPLQGRAKLDISVADNAAARFPGSGRQAVGVAGFRTFRQVKSGGSFEGTTEVGLGVAGRHPFRVQLLSGPGHDSRLVIDVAHRG